MLGSPGKQPGFHVFLFDEMAGGGLALGLANFGEHSFLIGYVRLDGIGDQEIGASARGLGELREAFLDFRLEADAERAAACVRHEHSLSHQGTETWATFDARDQKDQAGRGRADSDVVRPALDFQLSTVNLFSGAVTGIDADIFRGEIAGPVARGGAACVQIHHDVDMRR